MSRKNNVFTVNQPSVTSILSLSRFTFGGNLVLWQLLGPSPLNNSLFFFVSHLWHSEVAVDRLGFILHISHLHCKGREWDISNFTSLEPPCKCMPCVLPNSLFCSRRLLVVGALDMNFLPPSRHIWIAYMPAYWKQVNGGVNLQIVVDTVEKGAPTLGSRMLFVNKHVYKQHNL
jgi:hypothetical protein